MRRQQRPRASSSLARATDFVTTACKAIALARHRLDEWLSIRSGAERTPQRRDCLLEAVVGHRNVLPDGFDKHILGHDRALARQQLHEDTEVTVGKGQRCASLRQTTGVGIDHEVTEGITRHEDGLSRVSSTRCPEE